MRARSFLPSVAALVLLGMGRFGGTPVGAVPGDGSALPRPEQSAHLAPAPVESGSDGQVPAATGRDLSPAAALPRDSAAVEPPGLSDSLAVAADSLPGRHSAIAVGERLVFTVRYGVIRAGTAVMENLGRKKVAGRPAYHIVSTASSNSVFDGIYRVRDRVVSLMDEDRLYSLYFEKHLREGRYRADQQVRFDLDRAVALYQDGYEAAVTPGAFDVLAAFYRVRTMPLEPGQQFFLDSHDNRKNYPLRVTVLRRERVETPAGTFDCLVVEPTLRSGAFFKNEGKLTIWLTDDDRRIPVLMRSKLPIGAISVELTEYQRPLHPPSSVPAQAPADSTEGAAADSARAKSSNP